MTTLNWRTATALELHDNLIPDPNASHNLLNRLQHVRVAVEGSFLHIDPRRPQDPGFATDPEFDVYIVPVPAVKTVSYRATAAQGNLASVV